MWNFDLRKFKRLQTFGLSELMMALSQVSSQVSSRRSSEHGGRMRGPFTFALIALAVAFVIIGNMTAAGPAVYRPLSVIAQR
jgi:hypothetical protein